jgi:thioesterase domain-containing protein
MQILMPIKTAGERPPLFCINGEPLKMAKILSENQPLYGLCNAYNPNFKPPARIEQLAEIYVREMRLVQPEGPYHLCGFSVGGLIAYEMARQLILKGQQVEYLALIDPVFSKQSWSRAKWVKDSFAVKGRKLEAAMYFAKRGMGAAVARTLVLLRVSKAWAYELMGKDLPIDLRRVRHAGAIRASHHSYVYKPFASSGIVFHPAMSEQDNKSYTRFWNSVLTEGAEVHTMTGITEHLEFLAEPHLTRVTQKIDADMDHLSRS